MSTTNLSEALKQGWSNQPEKPQKYHLVVRNSAGGQPDTWVSRGEYATEREAAFAAIERNRDAQRSVGAGGRANIYAVRSPSGKIVDAEYNYGQDYGER